MKSLLTDIWQNFRSLPGWVQCWVGCILVPINIFAVIFWQHPDSGLLIAALAVGGMLPNIAIMIAERGFAKSMAISHLLFWIPLLFIIAPVMGTGSVFGVYLVVLFAVDVISILFDINDTRIWLKNRR